MNSKMIGVDVGGTFTDVFILDEANGTAEVAKVPTTRPDQSGGFLNGIQQRVSDLSQIAVVVHGTTAGTNALLERKGAKIGVICTQGLRDVLEMRRREAAPSRRFTAGPHARDDYDSPTSPPTPVAQGRSVTAHTRTRSPAGQCTSRRHRGLRTTPGVATREAVTGPSPDRTRSRERMVRQTQTGRS